MAITPKHQATSDDIEQVKNKVVRILSQFNAEFEGNMGLQLVHEVTKSDGQKERTSITVKDIPPYTQSQFDWDEASQSASITLGKDSVGVLKEARDKLAAVH